MAYADITTTTGNTYVATSTGKDSAIRTDLTNSTVVTPKTLEMAHTPGTASRPTRRLIKLSNAAVHPDTGAPRPYSVHTVITTVNDTVSLSDLQDMVAEQADLLSDTTLMTAFLKGSLG
jgi:hypothetical protein